MLTGQGEEKRKYMAKYGKENGHRFIFIYLLTEGDQFVCVLAGSFNLLVWMSLVLVRIHLAFKS